MKRRLIYLAVLGLIAFMFARPQYLHAQAPSTLTLTVAVNNTWGGSASPFNWTVSAIGPTSLIGSGSVTGVVPSGFISFRIQARVVIPPYSTTGWSCAPGGGVEVYVPPSTNVTCQIPFSSIPAILTLYDTVDNSNGGNASPTAWTLEALDGPTPVSGQTGSPAVTNVKVKPGSYLLEKSIGPIGYASTSWNCTVTGGSWNGAFVFLNPGSVATCGIVNFSEPATLTLVATVNNSNGGNAPPTAWTLQAVGPTSIAGPIGSSYVTNVPVKWGTYVLSESGPPGYAFSGWSCTGRSLNGDSFALVNAAAATCQINNVSQPVTLTSFDVVDNTNGGSAQPTSWTLSASGPTTIVGVSGTSAVTNVSVKAGAYTLLETGGPSGYAMSPWSCDTSQVTNGNQMTLVPGQIANCAINNVFAGSNPPSVFLGPGGSTANPTVSIAEPINTATGNYYSTHTDLVVQGRGISFIFNRQYNSLDNYIGPLGVGWAHSYNVQVTMNTQTGVATVKNGDGSTLTFISVGTGAFTAAPRGA